MVSLKLLLAVLAFVLLGYPTAGFLFPTRQHCPAWERLALAYGLGVAWLTLEMLVVSMLGVRLSVPILLTPWLIIAFLFGWWARRSATTFFDWKGLVQTPTSVLYRWRNQARWVRVLELGLLMLIVLELTFVMARALIYPPRDYDTFANWGFRAKVFFYNERVILPPSIAHPEHPLLVPLAETWMYLNLGQVNDTLVQVLFPLFGLALFLIFYYESRRQHVPRTWALLFTAILATAGNAWIYHFSIAYADLALGFYYGVGMIFLYQWMSLPPPQQHRYLLASGLFLGAALWTKSEGLPLVLINCIVLGAHWFLNRKVTAQHTMAALLGYGGLILGFFLPWLVFWQLNGYPLLGGHVGSPRLDRIPTILTSMLSELLNYRQEGMLWGLVLVTTALTLRKSLRRPLVYLLAVAVLQIPFLIATYSVAPYNDFQAFIAVSFDRMLIHIIPVTVFLVALQIGIFIPSAHLNNEVLPCGGRSARQRAADSRGGNELFDIVF